MPGSVAGIALPEGDPGAIFDASRQLNSIAGAFEGGAGVVADGVAQVGSWEGQASESFRALAGNYRQVATSSASVLHSMAQAVRAYGQEFRDSYERIERLQQQAADCLDEIAVWEARRDDAAAREGAARSRAASELFSAPADLTGASLAAQASALAEADAAADERARAENRIAELRDRLEELRRRGEEERERALDAERRAAGQVLSMVDGFPAVGMPGGPASGAGAGGMAPAMSMVPAVYRGGASSQNAVYRGGAQTRFADFSLGDILDFSRDVDREMGPVDEKIYEGGQAVEGFGREVTGIANAERSWDAFGRGDILGGLFYGALASPFGKLPKAGKAGSEALGQVGRHADDLDGARTAVPGTHGPTNPYPSLAPNERWTPDQGTPVIGRQPDTEVAQNWPDHTVLNLPKWGLDKNDEWIQSIIDQRGTVYVGSPATRGNLWDVKANRPTVFARELEQLRDAGYQPFGDYLVPP